MWLSSIFVIATLSCIVPSAKSAVSEYKKNTIFYVYNKNGSYIQNWTDKTIQNCDPSKPYVFMIHGWTESVRTAYVSPLVANFIHYRGCVIFMDYSYYGNSQLTSFTTSSYLGYVFLLKNHYSSLVIVAQQKLQHFQNMGYDVGNCLMWGFSFGAQIATYSAYKFSEILRKQVYRIDLCDPAGPLFCLDSPSVKNTVSASVYSQCIHTSIDEGTILRYCKQDIDMGYCGFSQAAANATFSNHQTCPWFYISSFTNNFRLIPKPLMCINSTVTPDVTKIPPLYMGYRLNTTALPGEYYAATSPYYPYNVV